MTQSYRAFQVTAPGEFQLVELPVPHPSPTQVRIRIVASGICHSDSLVVEGGWEGLTYPRVPGHEIVGEIDALGSDVQSWRMGQRVGVGWFGGQCGHCRSCRRGDFINCFNLLITGLHRDGGYAEIALVEARALAQLPEGIPSNEAAPLLCAGVTTFNALRNSTLRCGDTVAIQGLGGLGHLAVQFARRMGFRTVAIARGEEKRALALQLGAHTYIDSSSQDPVIELNKLGGADGILTTISSAKSMSPLLAGLSARGKFIVVGASEEPLEFSPAKIIFGSKTISGEAVGTPLDEEDALAFSLLQDIKPMIEVIPLEAAPEGYRKMMSNAARFRIVIAMESSAASHSRAR